MLDDFDELDYYSDSVDDAEYVREYLNNCLDIEDVYD